MFNGDDYQILFTAPFKKRSLIKSMAKKMNQKITIIGKINNNNKKNRSLIKAISKRMNQKITRIGKINNGFKKNSIKFDNKPLNLSNFKGYSHKF